MSFLSQEQQDTLKEKQWNNIIPDGAFIIMYQHDFNEPTWKRFAEILNFDASLRVVKIAVVATTN